MCHVSEHFTLRLPTGTTERIRKRAERAGTSPRALAQRYVEEALRQDDHPLIRFVGEPGARRAALVGRGLEVWEVIPTVRDNDNDVAEAADYLDVPQGHVEAAVTYYGEFRDEVDREIKDNEEAWEHGYAAWQAGQRALSS